MSSGQELFPFSSTTGSEPAFELALRGYEKRQVDKYVRQVEAEIAALIGEREDAFAQVAELGMVVAQLENELAGTRRFVASGEAISYRHLGARVEQILSLAEEQAADIRERAEHDLTHRELTIAEARAEIDAEANDTARDFQVAITVRRAEEERASAKRREDVAMEVEISKAYAAKIRSDVDKLYEAAQQESQRVGEATKAYAEKVRTETEAHAVLLRSQLDAELAQRRAATEQVLAVRLAGVERSLADARALAESEAQALITETRTRTDALIGAAQAEAATVIAAAQAESAAITVAAQADADALRAAAQKESDDVRAGAQAEADALLTESKTLLHEIRSAVETAAINSSAAQKSTSDTRAAGRSAAEVPSGVAPATNGAAADATAERSEDSSVVESGQPVSTGAR